MVGTRVGGGHVKILTDTLINYVFALDTRSLAVGVAGECLGLPISRRMSQTLVAFSIKKQRRQIFRVHLTSKGPSC